MYELASYTVVLDAGLMEVKNSATFAEIALRIITSDWIRRLWTLQEAYFSKLLFFYFSDYLVDLNELETLYRNLQATLISTAPLAFHAYYDMLLGPQRERRLQCNIWRQDDHFVTALWKAVKWGTTNKPHHETLALATLLNVNLDYFTDSEDTLRSQAMNLEDTRNQRMQKLLFLVASTTSHTIPAGMIFLPGPRLPEPGYGWAPRTWLTSLNADFPDPSTSAFPEGRLMRDGLLVRLPGFLLHSLDLDTSFINFKHEIIFPSDSSLREWYRVRSLDPWEIRETQSTAKPLAIVTINEKPADIPEIGILVLVYETRADIRYVRRLGRIWITRETKHQRVASLCRDFRVGKLSTNLCGEALLLSQKWCVDGPSANEQTYSDHNAPEDPGNPFSALVSVIPLRLYNWTTPFATTKKSKQY
jgi:hypothetical protein